MINIARILCHIGLIQSHSYISSSLFDYNVYHDKVYGKLDKTFNNTEKISKALLHVLCYDCH